MRLLIEIFLYIALACLWNFLAGYAGLVSVGQQAYVGLGGYALFALAAKAGVRAALRAAADRRRRGDRVGADRHAAVPPARRLFRHQLLGGGGGAAALSAVLIVPLGGGSGMSLPVQAAQDARAHAA